MGREGDVVRDDGDGAAFEAESAGLTLRTLTTKVRIGSPTSRHASPRTALAAATLVLLVVGLAAAALGAPMLLRSASASDKPELAAAIPSMTPLASQPSDSAGPGSVASADVSPIATWAPESDSPTPVGSSTPDGNAGGDPSWYQSLTITYDKTVSAGQSGSLAVANLGRAACTGEFHLTAFDVDQSLAPQDFRTDPEVLVYVAPPTWTGTVDLQLTCFSSGFHSGSSHTWHMPVTVGPAEPWLIHVTMSNTTSIAGVLNSLYVSYTIDSHETSNVDEGTCTFTATLADGGTIGLVRGGTLTAAGTQFFWVGGRAGELDLTIPPGSGPGTITWKVLCTDLGGVGYGATASASGTYALRTIATNPPTEMPTDPPAQTPSATPPPTPAPPTATPAPTNPPAETAAPPTATPPPAGT